ncbi:anti-sigma B factor antagonist [Streptacidiphilus sp. MAP12-16]|uniref:STAS domain-containing protein n=1 Tax=Streptacidiphilus sp. MAP12-16 TaxID=3156300 RepID=UPI003515AA0F
MAGTTAVPVETTRTVRAQGELDLVSAPSFRSTLHGGASFTPAARVVVDLSDVTFMDVSPLRELCIATNRFEQQGGWVRLVYTDPTVARLLRATRLADRFPRYATIADARAGRTSPPGFPAR